VEKGGEKKVTRLQSLSRHLEAISEIVRKGKKLVAPSLVIKKVEGEKGKDST